MQGGRPAFPTIDFVHLKARSLGGLAAYESFAYIFDRLEQGLGLYRMKNFHCHFSKIEYTQGGEKRHLTFEDQTYGPISSLVARLIHERKASPVIICESAGTQAPRRGCHEKYPAKSGGSRMKKKKRKSPPPP